MIISVYEKKNSEPVRIAEMQFAEGKKEDVFRLIDRFFDENGEKLFGQKVARHGIRKVRGEGDHQTSWHIVKGENESFIGRNESMLSHQSFAEEAYDWQEPMAFYDADGNIVESDKYIGVNLYKEGYVIKTGKEVTNLFGMSFLGYLSSIGTRKIRSCTKNDAKRFADMKKALTFLKKYKDTMKYCVSKYGWNIQIEPISAKFEMNEDEKRLKMAEKKRIKENQIGLELMTLVDEINKTEEEAEVYVPADTVEEEAVNRMKGLSLDYGLVIKPFLASGRIFMSEFGGILYDPDEKARSVLEEVRQHGGYPYHVVKSGSMYSVLYVSGDREDWEYEQYDRKYETIPAWVYNDDFGWSECGDIVVRPASGGLTRVG